MSKQTIPQFLFCCVFTVSLSAQKIILKGTIKDSLGIILPNANILAFPNTDEQKTTFAISSADGDYKLRLTKNIIYSIEISYRGQ